MNRTPRLDHAVRVAVLRSMKVATLLWDSLERDRAPERGALTAALCETVFHPHMHHFRGDDAQAAIHAVLGQNQSAGGLYDLDFLGRMADHYLLDMGDRLEARREHLADYILLLRDLHPAFMIGYLHVQKLRRREVTVEALRNAAGVQCPLGLPKPESGRAYADNHVHLGGVGITSHPLFALMIGEGKLSQLGKGPRPLTDPTVHGSDTVDHEVMALKLNACVHAILRHALGDESRAPSAETLRYRQIRAISGTWLLERLSDRRETSVATDLILAMARLMQRDQAGGALQMLVTLALHLYTTGARENAAIRHCILLFIHLTNLMRSSIVMSGVGLKTFVKYYHSALRDQGEKYANRDRFPLLIGGGCDMVDGKLAKADAGVWREFANAAARHGGAGADPPWHRYHFSFHFIRREQKRSEGDRRRAAERQTVNRTALTLRSALEGRHWHRPQTGAGRDRDAHGSEAAPPRQDLGSFIRSFDVAGDENLVPIEVFAPALRLLREKPMVCTDRGDQLHPRRTLSIHAGEDFSNLVRGMRHVEETLLFCNFGKDDRIGHCLALGVDPQLWARRQGMAITTLQDHIDDLVWFWHHTSELARKLDIAARVLPGIRRRLEHFLAELPREEQQPRPDTLYRAWLLRRNCPDRALSAGPVDQVSDLRYLAPDVADDPGCREAEHFKRYRTYMSAARADAPAPGCQPLHIMLGQDGMPGRNAHGYVDYCSRDELDVLEAIQDDLLTWMDRRGVMIEACPTSNVYIARIDSYAEHPVFRWRPLRAEDIRPGGRYNRFGLRSGPVGLCLNTDDPAIFPTTIAMEHEVMEHAAIEDHGMGRMDAARWIDEIRQAGVGLFRRTHAATRIEPGS